MGEQSSEASDLTPAVRPASSFWGLLPLRRRLIVVGLAVLAVVALFWTLPVAAWVVAAYQWIRGLGHWAFATFVIIFTVLSMVGLPTSPLNVGAGLLFGLLYGFLAALAGMMAAATLCFLIARYLAGGWVRRRVSCSPRYAAVLAGLRTESWQLILLTRLTAETEPVFRVGVKRGMLGRTGYGFGCGE